MLLGQVIATALILLIVRVTAHLPDDEVQSCQQATVSTTSDAHVVLSWTPRIFTVKKFLTDNEIDHLISLSESKFTESKAFGKQGSSSRKSSTVSFNRSLEFTDVVIKSIVERIHRTVMIPIEHGGNNVSRIFEERRN